MATAAATDFEVTPVAEAQAEIRRLERELLLSRLRNRGALAIEVMPHQLSTTLMNHYLTIKERSLL